MTRITPEGTVHHFHFYEELWQIIQINDSELRCLKSIISKFENPIIYARV